MPALFAYLIAIGLLLGGGYEALSWLAAPEPVTLAAKTRSMRPRPSQSPAISATAAPDANFITVTENDQGAKANANESAPSTIIEPSQNKTLMAKAPIGPIQPNQDTESPAQVPTIPLTPSTAAISNAAPAPMDAAAKIVGRRAKLGINHSAKGPLALMTLRTIEYPDGRRVTQLLPYHGTEHRSNFGWEN